MKKDDDDERKKRVSQAGALSEDFLVFLERGERRASGSLEEELFLCDFPSFVSSGSAFSLDRFFLWSSDRGESGDDRGEESSALEEAFFILFLSSEDDEEADDLSSTVFLLFFDFFSSPGVAIFSSEALFLIVFSSLEDDEDEDFLVLFSGAGEPT